MAPRRIINAKDILDDIRAGMSDQYLMSKYNLSAKGLQSAFEKLINNRLITVEEIYGTPRSEEHDTVIIDDVTQIQRHILTVTAVVHDTSNPQVEARLHEVTDRGLTVEGIQARIGETKTLVIPCRHLLNVDDIWFEAQCLWTEYNRETGQWVSGFQITSITKEGLGHLRELVRLLTLG